MKKSKLLNRLRCHYGQLDEWGASYRARIVGLTLAGGVLLGAACGLKKCQNQIVTTLEAVESSTTYEKTANEPTAAEFFADNPLFDNALER